MKLTTRQRSQRSEAKAAANFNGKTQIASGALRHAKGDILTDRYLIEDKITEKSSYSLKLALLDKIRHEAFQHQRTPMFRVTLCDKHTFCILREEDLQVLLNEIK